MNVSMIDNKDTINIFTDASFTKNKQNQGFGCSGAVCTYRDKEITNIFHILDNTTSNYAEIDAVRNGISIAIGLKDQFKQINLFSDSQLSILGIRDRLINWKEKKGVIYGYDNTPIVHQESFIEIAYMIKDSGICNLRLWHQKGHVSAGESSIENAIHVFAASNGIRDSIDPNFIRYISRWNNYVDKTTRSMLLHTNLSDVHFISPLQFYPNNFYHVKEEVYKQLRDTGGESYYG